MNRPTSVLSPSLLPASIAIYTTVALAAFEGTAVAAALPQVVGDLGRLELLPWVITGYLFASGVSTVIAGPLIDMLGTSRVFRWAIVVFVGAGVTAGAVSSMPVLVAVRLVQGAGGGLLVAVGLAAVGLVYPDHLVGRAFAANSTVWGVMGAAAPAIAAFVLTTLSWRWIFFINLPLGTAALIAGWRVLPGPTDRAERSTVDVRGTALVAAFTLATLLAVDEIGPWSLLWGALAVAAAFAYRWHATRTPHPVLRMVHVAHQPYATIGWGVAIMITAAFAANIYLTLYVSAGRGAGPGLTAWSVFFFVLGWTVGANLSSRLLDRLSGPAVMWLGFASTGPGLLVTALAALADAPLAVVFVGLGFAGAGLGLSTNAGLTLLKSVTPNEQIGRATAAHQFIRNQGFTLGAAMGGAVLLFVVSHRLGAVEPVQRLLAGDTSVVTGEVSAAVRAGYATTIVGSVLLISLAMIPLRSLRRHLAGVHSTTRR